MVVSTMRASPGSGIGSGDNRPGWPGLHCGELPVRSVLSRRQLGACM